MVVVLLVVLLGASIALNVVQGAKISNMSSNRKAERKLMRDFIKALTVISCNIKNNNDDLNRRLDELERKQKESDKKIADVDKRVKELEKANGIMADNTYQLMKEGRIIKSVYNNVVFPYKFQDLSMDEVVRFFGRIS